MNQKIIIGIIGVIVFVLGGFFLKDALQGNAQNPSNTDGGTVACTMDVQICPDGSYVGRTPPSCAFAACPIGGVIDNKGETVTLTTGINKAISGLGVTLLPQELLEDSRCPINAVCIQAGTVRVRVDVTGISGQGSAVQMMTLTTPIRVGIYTIELIAVEPSPLAGEERVPGQYLFTFKIIKSIQGEVKG